MNTTTTTAGNRKCNHEQFRSEVSVNREVNDGGVKLMATIRMYCAECGSIVDFVKPNSGFVAQIEMFPRDL